MPSWAATGPAELVEPDDGEDGGKTERGAQRAHRRQLNWPETYSLVSCSCGLSKISLVGPDSTR